MNTDQTAAEAAEKCYERMMTGGYPVILKEDMAAIIKSAIEKAMAHISDLRDDLAVENQKLRLRAAHASEHYKHAPDCPCFPRQITASAKAHEKRVK